MWRDAPAFGVGEGSFAWRFRDYVPAGSSLDTFSHGDAHNTWLQLLATRGIAGVTAYALLVLAVARALFLRWRDPVKGPAVTAPILALAGFATYSLVSGLFYLQLIQLLFWLIVAIAAAPAGELRASSRFRSAVAVSVAIAVVVQLIASQPLFAEMSAALAQVTLRMDDREVDRFDITTVDVIARVFEIPASDGHLAVPAEARSDSSPATIGRVVIPFGECISESRRLLVSVNRTWSPADTGFGRDPRRLGVLVFEPTYLSE